MPGEASFDPVPTLGKLRAAMRALAEFHQATASFPRNPPEPLPSPGIRLRYDRLLHWTGGGLERLASAVRADDGPEWAERAARIICAFQALAAPLRECLDRCRSQLVPLQPCLRDIWHQNVLYQAERVIGLIDYEAMEMDTVAADVARLLGSMAIGEKSWWREGLEAYEAVRPLDGTERLLVEGFDLANVAMSGMNWLDWLFLQGRVFPDRETVIRRLDENLRRLGKPPAGL
jgi:homoserine kinase type II